MVGVGASSSISEPNWFPNDRGGVELWGGQELFFVRRGVARAPPAVTSPYGEGGVEGFALGVYGGGGEIGGDWIR